MGLWATLGVAVGVAVAVAVAGCSNLQFTVLDASADALEATSDGSTDAPDASTVDATDDARERNDGSAVPACGPTEVACNGACIPGSDCTGCTKSRLYCAPTRSCVTSCAACAALPIGCFACNPSQSSPIGTCQGASGTYCLNGDYAAAYHGGTGAHCDCSNAAVANCPGDEQVCKSSGGTDDCVTCGESGHATDGVPCKNGKTCRTNASPPRCM